MPKKRDNFRDMTPLSRLMLETAVGLGYKYEIVDKPNVYWLEHRGNRRLFYGIHTPLNFLPGGKMSDNKKITKKIWQAAKLPVAQDLMLYRQDYAETLKNMHLRFPVVVKPVEGTIKGTDVLTDIKTKKQLIKKVKAMFNRGYTKMLVEEFYEGLKDYRVLVLKGKVIAVAERMPPFVTGDGTSTIKELIKQKNARRAASKQLKLGLIEIDEELKNKLKHQSLSLRSVLPKGRRASLKNVCNLGAGGSVADVTDEICVFNKRLAVKAAAAMDMGLVGLDFLCADIKKPLREGKGIILEANEQPDIALHHFPRYGKGRMVAEMIIKESLKIKL